MSLGVALGLGPTPTWAQASALSDLNVPYLHYFGFGAFKVGDQNVWSVRGRWTPTIVDYVPRKVGLAARLSGALIGIRGPNALDELRNVGIATAAVGAELRVNLNERSLIRAYGDVGVAVDLDSDKRAGLGGLGALWETVYPWKGWELGLQPSADFVWSASSTVGFDDRLLGLQLKADARHHLGLRIFGNRAQAGFYVDVAHFLGDTSLDVAPQSSSERTSFGDDQFEVGVTFGTHPRPKIIFFKPLLNVGVRWGRNVRGIRIGLGDRLTRLPPIP